MQQSSTTMKYIVNGFLALSFLLLLGLATADEDVLDTSGDTVTPFDEYYILPFNFAVGGGLSLAANNKTTCPVDVLREVSEVENGMLLKVIPEARIGFVPTETSLTISFFNESDCAQSSDWILVKDNENWFVGIGEAGDHPGREIMTGQFMIEKYEKGYKLVFCPHSEGDHGCWNIGIRVDENHNNRLSLVDEGAYVVVFKKAN